MQPKLLALLLTTSLFANAIAQDGNYWSNTYSAGGYFMPGSVVANNGDSGVLFYNPALLAYNTRNAVSVSGNVYQWEKIRIRNGVGNGYNLDYSNGTVVPLLASNTLFFKTKNPFTIAYAIAHNPVMNFDASQRRDGLVNALNDSYSPGAETYIGQYSASNFIDETVGTLSAGFSIHPKLKIGFTFEGLIRKQNFLQDYKIRAIENTGADPLSAPIVSVTQYISYISRYIGLRGKFGLSYDLSPKSHLGLLITTPYLRVGGRATMLADLIINNLRLGSSDLYILANTRQTKLPVRWKPPTSIALGFTQVLPDAQIYLSGEYFFGVKNYDVIKARDEAFMRPDTASALSATEILSMIDGRRSVINTSIGVSYKVNGLLRAFFSLRTDFNFVNPRLYDEGQLGVLPNTANWDIYHCQLGINARKRKFNLRAGILLSYSHTRSYMQPISFDDPSESNLLLGNSRATPATRFMGGIMFSYIHNL